MQYFSFFHGNILACCQNVVNLYFYCYTDSIGFTLSNKIPNVGQKFSVVIAQHGSTYITKNVNMGVSINLFIYLGNKFQHVR